MSAEHESELPPPAGTQILWGRILVLLLALALVFWLGTTFSGDEAMRQQVAEQRDEIARLEAQIAAMEAEMAAAEAGGGQAQGTATGSEAAATAAPRRNGNGGQRDDGGANNTGDGTAAGGNGGATEPTGTRYIVESGDSLASIAQEVYGDPTRWRDIARANDLQEPFALTVGEALLIPDAQ
ncbi:MAG TPA: LysM domain-containing protein [Euzebyales bacterium]